MIDSCAAGCALRAVLLALLVFCVFRKKSKSFLFIWVSRKGAVLHHVYEQGSGPRAGVFMHGILLGNCKSLQFFFLGYL